MDVLGLLGEQFGVGRVRKNTAAREIEVHGGFGGDGRHVQAASGSPARQFSRARKETSGHAASPITSIHVERDQLKVAGPADVPEYRVADQPITVDGPEQHASSVEFRRPLGDPSGNAEVPVPVRVEVRYVPDDRPRLDPPAADSVAQTDVLGAIDLGDPVQIRWIELHNLGTAHGS
jgi:hypothetical protein